MSMHKIDKTRGALNRIIVTPIQKFLNSRKGFAIQISAGVIIAVLLLAIAATTNYYGGIGEGMLLNKVRQKSLAAANLAIQDQNPNLAGLNQITSCQSDTTPDQDATCVDADNSGTAITCGVSYRINDGPVQYDGDGDIADLPVGAKVEYLYNSSSNYAVHGIVESVPCVASYPLPILMKDWATTVTMSFFQQDDQGSSLVSATATEKLEAADVVGIKTAIEGDNEDYYQDPIYFCDIDRTYHDDVTTTTYGLSDNTEFLSADVPEFHSSTLTSSAHDGTKGAWALGNDIHGTSARLITTILDTDDTNAAGDNTNMTCHLDDRDWFVDNKKGIFTYGANDENDVDVGQAMVNVTLYSGSS